VPVLARVRRPNHATVVAYLALFVALGGTAYAVNTVGSDDVINDSLLSEDIKDETVSSRDIRPSTIGSGRVANNSLTSADIKNGNVNGDDIQNSTVTGDHIHEALVSGLDRCPPATTARFGDICAGGPNVSQSWSDANDYCASLNLRLPTLGEAQTLAVNYDVPGVSSPNTFWTDGLMYRSDTLVVIVMHEDPQSGPGTRLFDNEDVYTVCVTNPTN
jgi:hypothetical protein